jgi:hypothetical protein
LKVVELPGVACEAGAGAGCMTTPATDDGHFVQRAQAYFAGERPCLCGSSCE